MPGTPTTRRGLPVVDGDTDYVNTGDNVFNAITAKMDTEDVYFIRGVLSALPAASVGSPYKYGVVYEATDTSPHRLFWSTGPAWIELNPALVVDGAVDVGTLRTLGTGALQAAAGNDPRFDTGVATYGSDTPGSPVTLTASMVDVATVTTALPAGTWSAIAQIDATLLSSSNGEVMARLSAPSEPLTTTSRLAIALRASHTGGGNVTGVLLDQFTLTAPSDIRLQLAATITLTFAYAGVRVVFQSI